MNVWVLAGMNVYHMPALCPGIGFSGSRFTRWLWAACRDRELNSGVPQEQQVLLVSSLQSKFPPSNPNHPYHHLHHPLLIIFPFSRQGFAISLDGHKLRSELINAGTKGMCGRHFCIFFFLYRNVCVCKHECVCVCISVLGTECRLATRISALNWWAISSAPDLTFDIINFLGIKTLLVIFILLKSIL